LSKDELKFNEFVDKLKNLFDTTTTKEQYLKVYEKANNDIVVTVSKFKFNVNFRKKLQSLHNRFGIISISKQLPMALYTFYKNR
jgi:lipid A disaccharide synthetase